LGDKHFVICFAETCQDTEIAEATYLFGFPRSTGKCNT